VNLMKSVRASVMAAWERSIALLMNAWSVKSRLSFFLPRAVNRLRHAQIETTLDYVQLTSQMSINNTHGQ